MRGWTLLAAFWTVLLLCAAGGAAALQALGPPAPLSGPSPEAAHLPAPEPPHAPAAAARTSVALPEPALLESSKLFPPAQLPRVAADGRAPRTVYAAPAPPATGPKVAILLGGFGLTERDSRAALDQLPGPVSLAVSAYASLPPDLLTIARTAGHELLASIPMEPQGYPLSDEGTRSLRTALPPEDNRQNLEWSLSRILGEVGATGASDGMRGERFADVSGAFDPILDEVARRGLLYVDPRPGRSPDRPALASRAVDVVLDDSPARADIEAKLRDLERIARERGAAIGLAGLPRPVTLERVAAWTKTLAAQGITLVPVSALVGAPAPPQQATR